MTISVKVYWSREGLGGTCYLCKRPGAEYGAVLSDEYGLNFVGYLCSKCLSSFLVSEEGARREAARRALSNLIREVERRGGRRRSYRIVKLLPAGLRWERAAQVLADVMEALMELGIKVEKGRGRNSGHYQVSVSEEDIERLRAALAKPPSRPRGP